MSNLAGQPARSANPADLGLHEAATALRSGELSSAELTAACLERIATRDHRFGAFVRVYAGEAMRAAAAADAVRAAGSSGPLAGIPVALKDVIGAAGLPLTADSAVLNGNVAGSDSTVWRRLRSAGMVLIGHLHCGEFANGLWGANPWGTSFSPGGSSSGSGIALAARMVPATVGTDGRGSIRGPAAFNGVSAVKPTFGLVSTAGCIPITFTYDVVGPMARSAADCAALLSVMAGRDALDRATLSQPPVPRYPEQPRPGSHPLKRTRIGIPVFPGEPPSPGVSEVYERFQTDLAGLGAELISFDWPANPLEDAKHGLGDWVHILGAEAQVIHEQFGGRESLYRDEFQTLIAPMKASGSAVDYVRAQIKRADFINTWSAIFADLRLDAVVHPACNDELFRTDREVSYDALPRLMFGVWSDTNFPVVSVPAGLSPTDGSPVGMQIVGLPYAEPGLLQLAVDIQAATGYHLACPAELDAAPAYLPPSRREAGPQPPFIAVNSPLNAAIPLNAANSIGDAGSETIS
jgi:aspartyl-tRNA(Asn)/glutamyl-tRNA(Gln) amidotransferase subunit A